MGGNRFRPYEIKKYDEYVGADSISAHTGITLIALIITIIIMLILAGIVITITIGENGLINKAQMAGKNYVDAEKEETNQFAKLENEIEELSNSREQVDKAKYEELQKQYENLQKELQEIKDNPPILKKAIIAKRVTLDGASGTKTYTYNVSSYSRI